MTRGELYENQSDDLLSAVQGRYQGETDTRGSRGEQVGIFISQQKRKLRFKLKATLAVFKLAFKDCRTF